MSRNLTVRTTTISMNQAIYGLGGGLSKAAGSTSIRFIQTTVAYNQAWRGGGIYTGSDTNFAPFILSSVLARNNADEAPDCFGFVASGGGNFIGNTGNCQLELQTSDIVNADPLLQPLTDNGGGTRTHAFFDGSGALDNGNCGVDDGLIDQRGQPRFVDLPTVVNGLTICDMGAYEAQGAKPPGTATASPTPTNTLIPTFTSTVTPTPTATYPSVTPLPTRTPTGSPTPLPPATILVNSVEDVIANDGRCTLREAITAANSDTASGSMAGECAAGTSEDVILISGGIYRFTKYGEREDNNLSGDLDVHSDITLIGAGRDNTTIDGGSIDRVLHQHSNNLMVVGVTIMQGFAPSGESGGGILIRETALSTTLLESRIVQNYAGSGTNGEQGPYRGAGDAGHGGGIAHLGGALEIFNSELSQNFAGRGGDAGFGGDHPYTGAPGGAPGLGGGLYSIGGTVTIHTSLIAENRAGNGGRDTRMFGRGIGGDGGGIYSTVPLTVEDSLIRDNRTGWGNRSSFFNISQDANGGGLWVEQAEITNTTISANRVDGDMNTFGGGIYYQRGETRLTGVTIAFNQSSFMGGGLSGTTGDVYVANTIIERNTALDGASDCFGTITSMGYNLIDNALDCMITGDETGNLYYVSARLRPLTDNLGATQTHGFYPGSPAADTGNCFGLTSDQRGLLRPADQPNLPNVADGCDMGAYEELPGPEVPPTTPSPTVTSPPIQQQLFLPLIRR